MKLKIIALLFHMMYLPFSLFYSYKLLEYVGGTELMWFLWWLLVPMAVVSGILSYVADHEEKD